EGRERLNDPTALGFELARLYYLDRQPSSMIHELLNQVERKPEYLESIKGQLQFYLRDEKDFALLQEMLEKRNKRHPGNPVYAELLIWRLIQQKEFKEALELAINLDKQEEQGQRVLRIAGICSANEAYEAAAKAYEYLIDKGPDYPLYNTARVNFLDARRKHLLSGDYKPADLVQLEKDHQSLLQDLGKSQSTAPVMRELAMLKGRYLDKTGEAIALLEETVALAPGGRFEAECKLDLGDLYILADDVWEATLLYGQVEKAFKDNPLGQEAKFRNARLSYYIGEFEWAKGQLDILKASTSQLMANDALNLSLLISENPGPDSSYGALKMYAAAELLAFRNQQDKAIATLDSIHRRFPGHALNDDILMAKAGIFIRRGQLDLALAALNSVTKDYAHDIWADDALFKLGELYETRLGDPEK
ncbi:MAG TPA: tetratricopeptide repeat protein, partial [Anseongella sp.]|nr:tetratricopeptide repeat protein [Anseongella sp.]